jgi:hypothetical protein
LGFFDPRVSLGLADRIAALEGDISGFISMKFHKEIDDDLFVLNGTWVDTTPPKALIGL